MAFEKRGRELPNFFSRLTRRILSLSLKMALQLSFRNSHNLGKKVQSLYLQPKQMFD